jgi:hypothetical protein
MKVLHKLFARNIQSVLCILFAWLFPCIYDLLAFEKIVILNSKMGFGVWGLGFGVWGLGFGVWGLGFGVWGLGFGVWGLGFGVWGLGARIQNLLI